MVALRQVVTSSGRRRRATGDTEADVEYSGSTEIGTPAVVEQQLLAATEQAAAASDVLEGGAAIKAKLTTTDSSGETIVVSTVLLGLIAFFLF